MAIATAAKQIIVDGQNVAVAGGQENISALQNAYLRWAGDEKDPNVIAQAEHAYMPMLMTAENVAQVPMGSAATPRMNTLHFPKVGRHGLRLLAPLMTRSSRSLR